MNIYEKIDKAKEEFLAAIDRQNEHKVAIRMTIPVQEDDTDELIISTLEEAEERISAQDELLHEMVKELETVRSKLSFDVKMMEFVATKDHTPLSRLKNINGLLDRYKALTRKVENAS